MCRDYRIVNINTITDIWPLLCIDKLLKLVERGKAFFKVWSKGQLSLDTNRSKR